MESSGCEKRFTQVSQKISIDPGGGQGCSPCRPPTAVSDVDNVARRSGCGVGSSAVGEERPDRPGTGAVEVVEAVLLRQLSSDQAAARVPSHAGIGGEGGDGAAGELGRLRVGQV